MGTTQTLWRVLIDGFAAGAVSADTRGEACCKADTDYHTFDGETLTIEKLGLGETPPPTNASRLKSFRRDGETHEISLGTLVEVDVTDHAPFNIEKDKDGEELVARIVGKLRLFVVALNRDCDGTPLYTLATHPVGPPEDANVFDRRHLMYRAIAQQLVYNGVNGDALTVLGHAKFRTFEEWMVDLRGY